LVRLFAEVGEVGGENSDENVKIVFHSFELKGLKFKGLNVEGGGNEPPCKPFPPYPLLPCLFHFGEAQSLRIAVVFSHLQGF